MSGRRASLLFVSGDPGGITSLAPVIDACDTSGDFAAIHLWLHADSLKAYTPRHPLLPRLDAAAIRALGPDLIITGTSMEPGSDDKRAVRLARDAAIPSIAFVDFWSNYAPRFADKRGALHFPDCIAAVDEAACREMAALGFPQEKLTAIGPLRLAGLPAPAPGRKGILFVSQALEEGYGGRQACRQRFGYCPEDAFTCLHAAIQRLADGKALEIPLAVRFHPREKPFPLPPGVADRSDGEATMALARAEIIAGMTGSMLIDAYFMKLPTFSIQPGLKGEDALMLSRQGFIPRLDTPQDVARALPGLRQARPEIAPALASWGDGQGVGRFLALIRQQLA